MKLLALILLFSLPALSAEVAVVENMKDHSQLMFSFTDESLYGSLDKAWITHPCKSRFVINNSVREYYLQKSCKAELIKFILNSGYKTIDLGRTFVK